MSSDRVNKIVVLGATGKAGTAIVNEFVSRNIAITAVARDPSRVQSLELVTVEKADVSTDDLTPILAGATVVINVVGPPPDPQNPYFQPNDEGAQIWLEWQRKIIQTSKDTQVGRLVLMGGAGTLDVGGGVSALKSGAIPPPILPIATAHAQLYELIKKESNLTWTVLTPPFMIQPGVRTGSFKLGAGNVEGGTNSISYEDYAVALVDEVQKPEHLNTRFTVSN